MGGDAAVSYEKGYHTEHLSKATLKSVLFEWVFLKFFFFIIVFISRFFKESALDINTYKP